MVKLKISFLPILVSVFIFSVGCKKKKTSTGCEGAYDKLVSCINGFDKAPEKKKTKLKNKFFKNCKEGLKNDPDGAKKFFDAVDGSCGEFRKVFREFMRKVSEKRMKK